METSTSAPGPAAVGMNSRDFRGPGLIAAWLLAVLSAVTALMALAWMESGSYPGMVEVIAVFSWIFMTAVAVVMTTATLAWFWDKGH